MRVPGFMMMVMFLAVMMTVVMPVFVGMAADFHIAAAETASAFFAHKIVSKWLLTLHPFHNCNSTSA